MGGGSETMVVVGDGGEIMASRGLSWVVVAKMWLAVGSCGWLWVVTAKLWLVVDGRGYPSFITYFMVKVIRVTAFLTPYVPREGEHFIFKEKWIEWAWLADWYWSVIAPPLPPSLPQKWSTGIFISTRIFFNLFMWLFIGTKFHNISLLAADYIREIQFAITVPSSML